MVEQNKLLCPSCNDVTNRRYLYHKEGIPIVQCLVCGIGKACPDEFDPEKYYDASYFDGSRADGYSNYVAAKNVLQTQFQKDINLLKKLGANGGVLIEIGSAYGYFLEVAKKHYKIYGLELCEEAVVDCHKRGLTSVKHGAISREAVEEMPMAEVVVLLDVIEHLPDPRNAMLELVSKLNPGGLMLLTTGDFSSLTAKLAGRHWRLMTPPQHLWFFSLKSMKRMAETLGLEVVHIDHPFKTVPLGLIIYQICRYFSFNPTLPNWMHEFGVPINLFDAMRIVFRKNLHENF